MLRIKLILRPLAILAVFPLMAGAAPSESDSAPSNAPRAIQIEIVTDLNFSRAAVIGRNGGEIKIMAQNNGQSSVVDVVDLGGYAMAGQVRVYGEPGRSLRIDLPHMVRMTSANGGVIEISDIRTNLSPSPRLDTLGQISFAFGGRLTVTGNASGAFRGRIPVTAEYE